MKIFNWEKGGKKGRNGEKHLNLWLVSKTQDLLVLGSLFQQSQCCIQTGHVLGQLSFLQRWTWLASLNWPLWVCSWPGRLEDVALSSLREEIAGSSPCLQYPAKCLLKNHVCFTNTSDWHFHWQVWLVANYRRLYPELYWVSSQSLHHSWRVSFSLESEKLSLAQAGHGHSPPTIQGSAYLQRVLAKTSGMIMKVSLFLSCDQETGGHVQKVAIKFLPPSHHTITCVTHSKNVYEDLRTHCSWATALGQGRSFDGDLGSFAVKDALAFRFITGGIPVSCLDFPRPLNCPPACTSSPCPSLWWMRPHVLTSSPIAAPAHWPPLSQTHSCQPGF